MNNQVKQSINLQCKTLSLEIRKTKAINSIMTRRRQHERFKLDDWRSCPKALVDHPRFKRIPLQKRKCTCGADDYNKELNNILDTIEKL